MSLLDQAAHMIGSQLKGAGGDQLNLISSALEMSNKGGQDELAGLVQACTSKGLGDMVSSWISTGPNAPIAASQIKDLLGEERIGQTAARIGLTPDVLSTKRADLLPGAVDKLTPEGKLPAPGMLDHALAMLKSTLS